MAAVTVDILLLLGGIALVVFTADRMVLASADVAARWGISPVVVGAVIIGFGTSLPEMTVSLLALDQPNGLDLAVGNAVGSNIANISLILAIAVIVYPFGGQTKVIKREGGLMLSACVLVSLILWDGTLRLYEGVVLLVAMALAGYVVVSWSRASPANDVEEIRSERATWVNVAIAAVALAGLLAGSRAMVIGAESIALAIGLSEGVVGLTILALGTSLPELGTVIASARRGRNDLVLGNVLGSNIFNALGVIGASGLVGPGVLETDFRPDLVVMVLVAVLAGAIAWSGDRLRRAEGVLLLAAYPLAILLAL